MKLSSLLFSLLISFPILCQDNPSYSSKPYSSAFQKTLMMEVWSDDFSSSSTWTFGHDTATCSLDWEIGTGLSNGGSFPIDNIYSTTAANGFAMLDSDEYGLETGGTDQENAWITTSLPIDLSDAAHVILEFESYYYKWAFEECYVVVSTSNNDWPNLSPDFDSSQDSSVFVVWPGMSVQDPVANPTHISLDISEIAGNQSEVWIRFNWTGTYGYSWFIDDVSVFKQAADDMKMESASVSHLNTSIHYPQVPVSQFDDRLYFKSNAVIAGYLPQDSVVTNIEFKDQNGAVLFAAQSDTTLILYPEESHLFNINEDSLYLTEGIYSTQFLVVSDEEQGGNDFDNNLIEYSIALTDDIMAVDGIGVFEQGTALPIGTSSFLNAEDDSYLFSQYRLSNDSNFIHGVEILLSPNTTAGGSIIPMLFSASNVLDEDTSSPLFEGDAYIITSTDVDNGMLRLFFDDADSIAQGNYMAGIKMNSNAGENPILIENDISFIQDSEASLMLIDGEINTTPNAAAIRLITKDPLTTSIAKHENILSNIIASPNPAHHFITIDFSLSKEQDIQLKVQDLSGKQVVYKNLGKRFAGKHSYKLVLESLPAGIYIYTLDCSDQQYAERFVVIK